jgi:hypothetical protein
MPKHFSRTSPSRRRLLSLTPRRALLALAMAGALNLQGCATSTETFGLGALVGAAAGISAVTCTVLCN